jgi:tetratricopeptide (TPR) repeat protein
MKTIFAIVSTIPISLGMFSISLIAVVSRSQAYPQLVTQSHIAQAQNSAEAYFEQGNAKSQAGNKKGAIADYDRAIILKPKYPEAYYNRGNTKSELGDKQGAITDYDRAIILKPKYPEAYYNRGNTKSELGDKQGAITDYDRAIILKPKYPEAYANRGVSESELGNKQGAITHTRKAAELFRQQGRMDLYQKAIDFLKTLQGN